MSIKFSIIIPVYNVERYLVQCLESIISQSIQDYEVILVDDGSTDSSPSICDNYANRSNKFRVLHKKNEGVSVARNIGLSIASGEYVCFVDSDDWLEPNYLSTLDNVSGEADLIYFSFAQHCEDKFIAGFQLDKFKSIHRKELENYIIHLNKNLLHINFYGYTWNKMFKRNIIENNGIRFVPGLSVSEDEIFTNDYLIHSHSLLALNNCIYNYRWKTNGLTFKVNDFREYKLLIERTLSFSKTLENDTASIFFRRKALGFLEQGIILSNFKWRYLIKEMMMLNKEFH